MKSIACITLALCLTACGVGSNNGQTFNVGFGGHQSSVEGMGATTTDRQHDAIAYAVSQIKPGSPDDLALNTTSGLLVAIDDGFGHNQYATVYRLNGALQIVFASPLRG